MAVKYYRHPPPEANHQWLPDYGEISNPGWMKALNVVPYANGWLIPAPLTERTQLASADIRGFAIHPSNGTNKWKIYYGYTTHLREVEPATWGDTDRSGATYTVGASDSWQFLPYGNHMVATGGHSQQAQIRLDDAGNFANLVTNSEPVIPGGTATGNWPPKPKFIAQWGLALVMANINDTGPASAFDDASGINASLLWISDKTGRTWSIVEEDDGTGATATLDAAAAVDKGGGLVGLPATGHGLTAGNTVTVSGSTNYDSTFTLDPTTSVNELVVPATFVAETFAGTETVTRAAGTTYNSHRSTFLYLNDRHGKITALAGGEEFGVVGKATAVYRATYGGTFRADVKVASAEVGWVFPNAGAWGPNHEFYFWSTAGPAVMTHSGVQVLGIGRWQRTLFDPTYLVDTYNMNSDQSAEYLLFCEYSKATDIVTWYYRRDQDTPDMALHYHRGTGRASVQDLTDLRSGASTWSATVLGSAAIPFSEVTDFTGAKDILVVSKDSGGNAHIYQPATDGAVIWDGKPTLESGYLELVLYGKAAVLRARPRFSLNTGATGPQVTMTLDSKHVPAGDAAAANQKSSSTVDAATGMVHLTGAISAAFNRMKMEFGNATLDNIKNIAEIEGFDLAHDPGESL